MNDTKSKRREWVKTAAIIFLAVLLVLTFFSNTILNRSLPEVAAQYPTSGSINLKIRGSGAVSSNQTQNVSISESRKVKGIAIRVGDTVTEGQALFLLADTESSELNTAKQTLDTMELAYEKALLDASLPGDSSNYDLQKAQLTLQAAMEKRDKAKVYDAERKPLAQAVEQAANALAAAMNNAAELPEKATLDDANETLEKAKAAQEKAKTDFDYYAELHGISSYGSLADELDKLDEEREALEDQYDEYTQKIREANGKLDDASFAIDNAADSLRDTIREAADSYLSSPKPSQQLEEIQNQYNAAKSTWDSMVSAQYSDCVDVERSNPDSSFRGYVWLDEVMVFVTSEEFGKDTEAADMLTRLGSLSSAELTRAYRSMAWWHITLDAAKECETQQAAYDTVASEIEKEIDGYRDSQKSLQDQLDAKDREIDQKQEMLNNRDLSSAYDTVKQANEAVKLANDQVYQAQQAYDNAVKSPSSNVTKAQAAYDKAKEQLDTLEKSYEGIGSYADEQQNVLNAQQSLEQIYKTQAQNSVNSQKEDLDLQDQKDKLDAQRELVSKLESNASETIIYSPCSGTVAEVNVTAGDTTVMDQPMAVIELTDKGHTLSFEVTKEQATKVQVGDQAEVTGRWGLDITAVLVSIGNSKTNPGTQKVLTFDLKGDDVVAGQNLTLSVGQKSQNYEVIVPNSAIREDSSGKFLLVVNSKSTPLGNRYYVQRVDVEVMATDDNNSAVKGTVTTGDYIVITATAPLSSGDQVRLPE